MKRLEKGADIDINNISKGICFTAVIVNAGKLYAGKIDFWKEIGLNPTRTKELFDSKYMDLFRSEEANSILEREKGKGQLGLPLRHKAINDTLEYVLSVPQFSITQIVILGSGLDMRSIIYKDYPVSYFEVDDNKILSFKKDTLEKYQIITNSKHIGIDYIKEDLITQLISNGLDLQKGTHFIWEGNSMYLPQESINTLWRNITQNFKGHLSLSMDYFSQDFVEDKTGYEEHLRLTETFKALGTPFINGYNNINEFASIHNFSVSSDFSISELAQIHGVHGTVMPELEYYHVAHLIRNI